MAAAKTTQPISVEETKVLREAFAKIDLNGDGRLSANELQASLSSVLHIEKSEAQIQAMIAEYDTDGNGTIEFPEFVLLVRSIREAEEKKGKGNAGLASVVSGLLEEMGVDNEKDTNRVLVPPGLQRYSSEELSRIFQ